MGEGSVSCTASIGSSEAPVLPSDFTTRGSTLSPLMSQATKLRKRKTRTRLAAACSHASPPPRTRQASKLLQREAQWSRPPCACPARAPARAAALALHCSWPALHSAAGAMLYSREVVSACLKYKYPTCVFPLRVSAVFQIQLRISDALPRM
eukprot:5613701-Pleurochrysis_carterae.AAC.3